MTSQILPAARMALLIGSMLLAAARLALAESRWVDARQVGPFMIQSEFPLTECETTLVELPQLEQELIRTLAIQPAKQPIEVYLFADGEAHRAYLTEHFPHVPYRRAMFIKEKGQSGVYAYRQSELDVDLRHECTHALLHSGLTNVPLWLDEGIAEYFEVPASGRAFDHPHFDMLRWNMRLGMIRSVAALEEREDLSEMTAFDYRYAWAWVHFMMHGPPAAHQALVRYLAEAQRTPNTAPLSERLEQAVPGSTERMVQHFKYWQR